jgi:hypothetical protein
MNPILPISASFTQDALAYVGSLFTSLSTLILLIIGVPVGFWVISKAISLVRRQTRTAGGGGRRGTY